MSQIVHIVIGSALLGIVAGSRGWKWWQTVLLVIGIQIICWGGKGL